MIMVHAFTVIVVHACTMILVHACTMAIEHVSWPTRLMFHDVEGGGAAPICLGACDVTHEASSFGKREQAIFIKQKTTATHAASAHGGSDVKRVYSMSLLSKRYPSHHLPLFCTLRFG